MAGRFKRRYCSSSSSSNSMNEDGTSTPTPTPTPLCTKPPIFKRQRSRRSRQRATTTTTASTTAVESETAMMVDDDNNNNNDEFNFSFHDNDESCWSMQSQSQNQNQKSKGEYSNSTSNSNKRRRNTITNANSNNSNDNANNNATTTTTLYSSIRKNRPKTISSHYYFNSSASASSSSSSSSSLPMPILLYQRQICPRKNKYPSKTFMSQPISAKQKQKQRQKQIKNQKQKQKQTLKGSWKWKECMRQSISFSKLNTPHTDAVLGIDPTGSYLISVGDGTRTRTRTHTHTHTHARQHEYISYNNGSYPSLSLRFYAVPSPSSLERPSRKKKHDDNIISTSSITTRGIDNTSLNTFTIISPHICTIPLSLDSLNRTDRGEDYYSTRSATSSNTATAATTTLSVTNTRIQILLSRDGAIGIAYVHHTTGEDASSSIVLFNIPGFPCNSGTTNGSQTQQQQQQQQQQQRRLIKLCKCPRIYMNKRSGEDYTLRNLLWKTKIVPIRDSQIQHNEKKSSTTEADTGTDECYSSLCDLYRVTSYAYILFNDEDDGYRIFWIESESDATTSSSTTAPTTSASTIFNDVDNNISSNKKANFKIRPERDDIVECCLDSFEEVLVDPETGCTYSSQHTHRSNDSSPLERNSNGDGNVTELDKCIKVPFEAYLHVDALLSDILYRRKKLMFKSESEDAFHTMNLPDFYYNIVSFNSSTGRSLTLVLTFANPRHDSKKKTSGNTNTNANMKKPPTLAAYALFVEIDLFDQSYSELEWVVHPTKCDSIFLRQWSNKLAIHKRMAEVHIGPFCVGDDLLKKLKGFNNLGVQTYECYNDNNVDDVDDDDTDVSLWEPFVLKKIHKQAGSEAPKPIAMSSLYNFCDVISNDAVVNRIPVSQMKSRDYPLEINYGTI